MPSLPIFGMKAIQLVLTRESYQTRILQIVLKQCLSLQLPKSLDCPVVHLVDRLQNFCAPGWQDRDCSVNSRLQFLEERASEMDGLKVTMSKLASNMAELSMAFKDHVQFVNNRLAAIHGLVSNTKKLSPRSRTSPRPRTSPVLETVEAERESLGSPRRSTTSWQR